MANYEREAALVNEIRATASKFISAVNEMEALVGRWNALGATFLDAYYAANAGGTAVSEAELSDSIAAFNTISTALTAALKTKLHKVRA